MFEAFVLAVLERVIGDYVSSSAQRKKELTRADVIELVTAQIRPVLLAQEQLDALSFAVKELDGLVARDPYLDWDGDGLRSATRRRLGTKSIPPADAVGALAATVYARRIELGLPSKGELTAAPVGPAAPVESEPAPDHVGPANSPFVAADEPEAPPWADRVLGLRTEVAKERRRRDR
jgi:hypothetical protein